MGKRWIVLVNRSPRGPLTFEEVSTLLSENVLKRTDLALQVSENNQEKSEWKFLWQYPEFDARNTTASSETPQSQERRTPVSSTKVQTKVAELLPDEIAMINPEDLIVSSKKGKGKSIQSFLMPEGSDGVDELPYNSNQSSRSGFRWSHGFVAVTVVLMGFFIKGMVRRFNEVTAPIEVESSSRQVARVPAARVIERPVKTPPSSGDSKAKVSPPVAPASSPEPSENTPSKARNEITLEEYERMKSDRAEQERIEEEDRRREEEAEEQLAERKSEDSDRDNETNDEETDRPRKRLSKRKEKSDSAKVRQVAEDTEPEAIVEERANDRDFEPEDENRN